MRNIDRLLPVGFSWWMLKSVRQLRRGALMTCLCVAMTALEAPWANAFEQFGEVHFPIACNAGVQNEVRPGACDAAYLLVSCRSQDFYGRFPGRPRLRHGVLGSCCDRDRKPVRWTAGPHGVTGGNRSRKSQSHRREDLARARLHCHYRSRSTGVRTRSTTLRACVPTRMLWSNSIASIPMIARPRYFMPMLCRP